MISPEALLALDREDAAGRANYEAFCQASAEWLPPDSRDWEKLPLPVRKAWIAGAKAAVNACQSAN